MKLSVVVFERQIVVILSSYWCTDCTLHFYSIS